MDVDELLTRVLIGVGMVFFVLGVAFMLSPGLAASVPFGQGAAIGVGLVALLLGLAVIRLRMRGNIDETDTPDPERPSQAPTPGDDVDQMLHQMVDLRQGVLENREQLEDRLELLAIAVIRDRYDCSEIQARHRLESGNWTDDDVAASFFQGRSADVVDHSSGGMAGRIFSTSGQAQGFEFEFRRTVNALTEVAGIETTTLEDEEEDETEDSFLGSLLDRGDDDEEDQNTVESNWNVADSSIPSFDTSEAFEDVSIHRTNRWLGVTAFALTAAGLGVFATNPGLMLAGTIGIAYTVYARAHAVPDLDDLVVERDLSEENPRPGEEVQVTVTIRNAGDSMLPDLRMVDVPPDAYVVTHGTPRLHTALQSGAETSFTYTVRVERGIHQWPLLTVGRDFSGGVERASLITPDTELSCVPPLALQSEVPVRAQTTQYAGDVNTKSGGSGLEFHSVRDYQTGDPMNRINWNRVAKTGELATIDFRQEKAATITILFDTRESAYVSQGPGQPHAVDQAVHVASDVFGALYDAGNLVGVAAFDTVPCWLAAGAGSEHLERARLLFAQHPALSPTPPTHQNIEGSYIDPMTHVRRRLQANSQLFMFSPLVDDYAAEVARRLDSAGHLVTVISPDTTADRTIGQRMTRIERTVRVRILREHGIRVVDWDPSDRLDLQFERAQARWA